MPEDDDELESLLDELLITRPEGHQSTLDRLTDMVNTEWEDPLGDISRLAQEGRDDPWKPTPLLVSKQHYDILVETFSELSPHLQIYGEARTPLDDEEE